MKHTQSKQNEQYSRYQWISGGRHVYLRNHNKCHNFLCKFFSVFVFISSIFCGTRSLPLLRATFYVLSYHIVSYHFSIVRRCSRVLQGSFCVCLSLSIALCVYVSIIRKMIERMFYENETHRNISMSFTTFFSFVCCWCCCCYWWLFRTHLSFYTLCRRNASNIQTSFNGITTAHLAKVFQENNLAKYVHVLSYLWFRNDFVRISYIVRNHIYARCYANAFTSQYRFKYHQFHAKHFLTASFQQ